MFIVVLAQDNLLRIRIACSRSTVSSYSEIVQSVM